MDLDSSASTTVTWMTLKIYNYKNKQKYIQLNRIQFFCRKWVNFQSFKNSPSLNSKPLDIDVSFIPKL